MRSILIILFFVCFKTIAYTQVTKRVEPAWVSKLDFNFTDERTKKTTGSFFYLLIERQLNLVTKERYNRSAFKILSSDGIQEMSDISVDFDPEFQTLTFHSIKVYRSGKLINKLASSEIKTVQREQSMDRYLYDGSKTAYINLTDIRIGDIVEYSYSIKGYNPVFKNHFCQFLYFDFAFPYAKLYQRVVFSKDKKLYFHYANGKVEPTIHENKQTHEYLWQLENVDALITDNNTPGWYDPYRYVTITDFKDWKDVNEWALKQFEVSASQTDRIKEELPRDLFNGTLEERLIKSIRFVQDEIRYLGFENGVHSHQPHSPNKILSQRFGDCKDKSLLLVVIARIQGIESSPVLVNTSIRGKLNEEPPTYSAFDHCVVQLVYNNKAIFIDPTINNQGGDSLNTIYLPFYGKGLVIDEKTKDLTALSETQLQGIKEEQIFDIAEIGGSAKMTVKTTYRGKDADSQRSEHSSTDVETTQKNYLTYYGNIYPDLTVDKPIEIQDDRENNILIVNEYYSIKNFWKPSEESTAKIFCEFYPQAIDRHVSIEKSTQRKAPYRLTYPLSYRHVTRINLPEPWNAQNDSKEVSSDYYSFENSVVNEGNTITITNKYETKAEEVPVDFINTFVNDHQKMSSELNYTLSYTKGLEQGTESNSFPYNFAILILSLIVGAILVIRVNKFNPPSFSEYGKPIGGWLILVAVGLCITPVVIVYTLVNPENNFFNQGVWSTLQSTNQYGLLSLIIFELAYNIIFLFFNGILILLFFHRRTSLPLLIMFFYGISFVVTIIDAVAVTFYSSTSFAESFGDVLKSGIGAAIWIPYFRISERVKETFTVRL
jgi:transglutaminase-like putative cysteine protease